MTVRFLARHDWDNSGAPRLGHKVNPAQFTRVNIHHTVMPIGADATVDEIVAYMRRLRTTRPDLGADVPYSFVVFAQANPADSIVAEGRGWQRTGAHTAGENSSSYGVAFAGNAETEPITPGVLDGIRFVGRGLVDPFAARPTLGHRDHKATACPGANLYAHMSEIQPPFQPPTTPEDDDMSALHAQVPLAVDAIDKMYERYATSRPANRRYPETPEALEYQLNRYFTADDPAAFLVQLGKELAAER